MGKLSEVWTMRRTFTGALLRGRGLGILFGALGLLAVCPGCALVNQAATVAVNSVGRAVEDCSERMRNRRWARAVWEEGLATDPALADASPHYEEGFLDGFAEYLYRGGTCEPPPLPPHHYRRLSYQTP